MRTSRLRLLLLSTVVLVLGGLLSPAAATAAPYCGITWGSLPRAHNPQDPGNNYVYNLRAGRHTCFDRLVIDIGEIAGLDAYDVRYVPSVAVDGSGERVPLRGGAALQLTLGATGHDDTGHPTYGPRNPREAVTVSGFRTFRQVAWLGSFEGRSTVGVGMRARLPFRVFVLDGPPGSGRDVRFVVDVAHRW